MDEDKTQREVGRSTATRCAESQTSPGIINGMCWGRLLPDFRLKAEWLCFTLFMHGRRMTRLDSINEP